jgi:hypothetical protein
VYRHAVAATVALLIVAGTPGPAGTPPAAASLRPVAAAEISALVPTGWEVETLTSLHGFRAAADVQRWRRRSGSRQGMEAYWVDATAARVPSDYYQLAARGPALDRLPCHARTEDVHTGRDPRLADGSRRTRDYVATASGICRARGRDTRWGAFVAAPGFGPVRRLGISRSGMYFVLVAVPEGPEAARRINELASMVRFGDTPVPDMLRAVGAPGRLI